MLPLTATWFVVSQLSNWEWRHWDPGEASGLTANRHRVNILGAGQPESQFFTPFWALDSSLCSWTPKAPVGFWFLQRPSLCLRPCGARPNSAPLGPKGGVLATDLGATQGPNYPCVQKTRAVVWATRPWDERVVVLISQFSSVQFSLVQSSSEANVWALTERQSLGRRFLTVRSLF